MNNVILRLLQFAYQHLTIYDNISLSCTKNSNKSRMKIKVWFFLLISNVDLTCIFNKFVF